jgi:hypothetical protein
MRKYNIYAIRSRKGDYRHITATLQTKPPNGYYPVKIVEAESIDQALDLALPKEFLSPDSNPQHQTLNTFQSSFLPAPED